ncbi:hypothetical protein [Polynucleobacter sp. AM-7D1]|uniref:hypothetical protein n=1 Tax=Polynucleobacter sp. AM-7D1 TaxID=2689102 RepID=UPI001BFD3A01|nr:hypothetical protein [Polynucleobacter sp. AM-7D1]QWE27931.1 hypothetical protein GQ359_05785 [Polynucleobacter sp. AM-7D1]
MDNNLFQERKVFDINEDSLYQAVKDLNYEEFMNFRSIFLQESINKNIIAETEDAKKSFWKRLMSNLHIKYQFVKPVSTSSSAQLKRLQRRT